MRVLALVLLVSGCGAQVGPLTVDGVSGVINDEKYPLPGTMGKTIEDQNRIDTTVARGCATGVYSRAQCRDHTVVSRNRRLELLTEDSAPQERGIS